jgi:GcrA cell cycle regulator
LPPLPASLAPESIRTMLLQTDPPRAEPVTRDLPPEPIRARPVDPTAAAVKPAPVRPVAARGVRLVPCCWPIGEPGTKSFRFCDHDALTGKPYCAEHAQLAYVKVRDRREEAA